MKRWCACKLGDYEGDGMRVPALNKYPTNSRCWSTGIKGWAICHFSAASMTAIEADADIHVLPDATLDASWGSMPAAVRNAVVDKLGTAGFTTSAIKTTWTVRQVITYLVQQLQPGVAIEAGDIVDIEQ